MGSAKRRLNLFFSLFCIHARVSLHCSAGISPCPQNLLPARMPGLPLRRSRNDKVKTFFCRFYKLGLREFLFPRPSMRNDGVE